MISVKIGCLRSSLFPSDASTIYSVTVYVHFTFFKQPFPLQKWGSAHRHEGENNVADCAVS